jgi:photosystem II stability/assembly factor-like uncharacterized protein
MTRKSKGMIFWFVAIVTIAVLTVPAFSSWRTISRADAPSAPSLSDPDLGGALKGMEFRNIGPATMGGRIDDYAVDESDSDTIYVGTAAGGVFKTTNGGTTWLPIFDHEATGSIGCIAIAPSSHDIVWVGTGEANNRQSASYGYGVYKSMDSGRTWAHMGLENTQAIGRIQIDPRDPNVVYVAALGGLWGENPDRGVYKTTDGGKTWTKSLSISVNTGVTDLALDPNDPSTLYAAAYERRRTVWGFNGGGLEGGIYKTVDGGASWTKLMKDMPYENGGDVGRIGLAIYKRNSNILYARIQHAKGGIFRSEDKGATWTLMSNNDSRAMYFGIMAIDPNNDLRVWAPAAALYFSEDGGKTFNTTRGGSVHSDYHAFWIDPKDSNHMMVGVDGGIYVSRDMGRTWNHDSVIAIGQFYEVTANNERPYKICGGLQDNGSWCGPSMSLTGPITNSDWVSVGGGDGFYNRLDPVDSNYDYGESQDGALQRRNFKTGETKSIRPVPKEGEPPYRFQWNSPIEISSFDHKTIYYGGNFLFRSADMGDHWEKLGPDLTNNVDRRTLKIMNVLPTKDELSREDGVEWWPCITVIGESPMTKDVIYVGTDDGNLQVTRDGGKSWTNVAGRVPGVPKGTYVTRVIGSKYNAGTAFAAFDGHRMGDFHVYLYMTNDYGQNWKPISNGIAEKDGIVHVVREDPKNQNILYAGTERGLFASLDHGATWSHIHANLPTVPVDDILIHPRDNDMILGTHGRSVWVMDDITPIQQMTSEVQNSTVHLFDIRPTYEWRGGRGGGGGGFGYGNSVFSAPNPPIGAILNIYLKNALTGRERVSVTITDKDNNTVSTLACAAAPVPGATPPAAEESAAPPPAGGGGGGRGGRGGGRGAAAAAGAGSPDVPAGGAAAQGGRGAGGGGRGGAGGGIPACDGKAGVNRLIWNLRYTPPPVPGAEAGGPGGGGGGGGFGGFGGGGGYLVEPGDYTVKVTLGDASDTKVVHVEEDPRIEISPADRAKRFAAIKDAFALSRDLTVTQTQIVSLKTSLDLAMTAWKARPRDQRIPDNVQKAADDFSKKVNEVAEKFANPPLASEEQGSAAPPLNNYPPTIGQRINQVFGGMQSVTAVPTADEMSDYATLKKELDDLKPQITQLVKEGLPALNKMINDAGVAQIVLVQTAGGGGGRRGGEDN